MCAPLDSLGVPRAGSSVCSTRRSGASPSQSCDTEIFYGFGAGSFEFKWWIVDFDNHSVPLEKHGAMVII
jgi:hypothetical protein